LFTTAQRSIVIPAEQPVQPRTVLVEVRTSQAVFDGGWWPRSWNPAEELPGLILALDERFGRIRRIGVSSGSWNGRFRGIVAGSHVVRVGWFTALDAGTLVASTDRGDQIDLLVVPPETATTAAEAAMATAADPANRLRATAILAGSPPVAAA
jgi:hypothetical protein